MGSSTQPLMRGILLLSLLLFNIVNAQPLSWQSRGVGGGGALFFPTINPSNDNEFYIACDMSQLFHSTDFGNSYTQVPFTKMSVGSLSTYEFTNNNNIAYCIANDGNINYAVRTINVEDFYLVFFIRENGNPLHPFFGFCLSAW